ncbi:MAG TPA: hypothetical protein PKA99_12565, partial [Dermatophilaceae bacterium]|nr:hypothetical protein [Dermatophilaceae bacterium]
GVVELCVPRLHDMGFWRELKGRVADTDPQARAPMSGEVKTSDSRIVVYQSRPLPDRAPAFPVRGPLPRRPRHRVSARPVEQPVPARVPAAHAPEPRVRATIPSRRVRAWAVLRVRVPGPATTRSLPARGCLDRRPDPALQVLADRVRPQPVLAGRVQVVRVRTRA